MLVRSGLQSTNSVIFHKAYLHGRSYIEAAISAADLVFWIANGVVACMPDMMPTARSVGGTDDRYWPASLTLNILRDYGHTATGSIFDRGLLN